MVRSSEQTNLLVIEQLSLSPGAFARCHPALTASFQGTSTCTSIIRLSWADGEDIRREATTSRKHAADIRRDEKRFQTAALFPSLP